MDRWRRRVESLRRRRFEHVVAEVEQEHVQRHFDAFAQHHVRHGHVGGVGSCSSERHVVDFRRRDDDEALFEIDFGVARDDRSSVVRSAAILRVKLDCSHGFEVREVGPRADLRRVYDYAIAVDDALARVVPWLCLQRFVCVGRWRVGRSSGCRVHTRIGGRRRCIVAAGIDAKEAQKNREIAHVCGLA